MKIRKNIAISETGFIFNPLTGDSFSVNETGLFVLHMLQEGKETESIMERFRERFELDKNSAEMDLSDFFTMLKSYQLTEYEEA
ncbi:MAG TPA: PqqD family protein [Proteiniphilum sp.]|nr:PqqD family protein [Dysgonomonadaceae bacterium zrk40]HOO95165.1 PqqD family protein [Proteiniphilum sp.]HPD86441.1 PqqD family protein [Proteiniphilum sp.]HPJ50554.1 PqqD family protein [Proteiniphilum sp.]HPR19695.1 PqqD family protein [Proteiniphilum sp.]